MNQIKRLLCCVLSLQLAGSGCGWGVGWKEAQDLPDREHPKDLRVTYHEPWHTEFDYAYVVGDTLFGYVGRPYIVTGDTTSLDLYLAQVHSGFLVLPDSSSIEMDAILEALLAGEADLEYETHREGIPLSRVQKVEEERFGWLTLGEHILAFSLLVVLITAWAYVESLEAAAY